MHIFSSERSGTQPHSPTLESPLERTSSMIVRLPPEFTWNGWTNKFAIMAAGQPIPTRCPLQQTQTSNHVLTTHFHGNSRTSRSQAARLDVPTTCTTKRSGDLFVVTLILCQLAGTPPRGPALEFSLFMPRTALVAFCGSLGHVPNHGGLARTPIREKAPTITHIESRTDQNGNLQTLETPIARLGMHPGRCGDHIVAPQDKSQLGGTHGHAPTRESPIHIHTQQRQSFFCLPEVSRIAKHVGNHGKWTFHSNAVPTSSGTEIESRTHHSLPRQLTNVPISNRWPRHANDLHNRT